MLMCVCVVDAETMLRVKVRILACERQLGMKDRGLNDHIISKLVVVTK